MDDKVKQEKLLRMMEEEQKEIRNSAVNQKKPEQLQESLSHSSPNLTKCSDCGREVSIRARECPHCGSPVGVLFQKAEVKRRIENERKELIDESKLLEEKIAKLNPIINPLKKRTLKLFFFSLVIGVFSWIAICNAWYALMKDSSELSFSDFQPGRFQNYFKGVAVSVDEYNELMNEMLFGPKFEILGISGELLSGVAILLIVLIIGKKIHERTFMSPVLKNQKEELETAESRLEENKKDSEKLSDNLKNINSPKVLATLAAGYGLHQMRGIRQELGEINESIADGGGDASGGDGGGGEADFSSFM